MMSSHSCESGMRPDTAEVDMEAGLVAGLVAALEVITDVVTVAALVVATGQRTTPTAI